MSVNAFPVASSGGLPEGATKKIFSGRPATGQYLHVDNLPAGTYLAKCRYISNINGGATSAFFQFQDNNVSTFVKSGESLIKITQPEANLKIKVVTGGMESPVTKYYPSQLFGNLLQVSNTDGHMYQERMGYDYSTNRVIFSGETTAKIGTTTDGGENYSTIPLPENITTTFTYRKFSYIDALDAWFMVVLDSADASTKIYKSTDDFATSTRVATLTTIYNGSGPKTEVKRLSNGVLYYLSIENHTNNSAGYVNGAFSLDSGNTWSTMTSPAYYINDITYHNDGYYYAAGYAGYIYRTTSLSTAWSQVASYSSANEWTAIDSNGAGQIIAVADGENYFGFTGNGSSWGFYNSGHYQTAKPKNIYWNASENAWWFICYTSANNQQHGIVPMPASSMAADPNLFYNTNMSIRFGQLTGNSVNYRKLNVWRQGDGYLMIVKQNLGNNADTISAFYWRPSDKRWRRVMGPGVVVSTDTGSQIGYVARGGNMVLTLSTRGGAMYSNNYGATHYLVTAWPVHDGMEIGINSAVHIEDNVIIFFPRLNGISYGGSIMTTDGGATWTSRSYLQSYMSYAQAVGYDPDTKNVLVIFYEYWNSYSKIFFWNNSTQAWNDWNFPTNDTSGSYGYLRGITWSKSLNRWLVVRGAASNGTIYAYQPSSNSVTSLRTVVVNNVTQTCLRNIKYVNGTLYLTCNNEQNYIAYSKDDGVTWSSGSLASQSGAHRVVYAAGIFLIRTNSSVLSSSDGVTFSLVKDYGTAMTGDVGISADNYKVSFWPNSAFTMYAVDVSNIGTASNMTIDFYETSYGDI